VELAFCGEDLLPIVYLLLVMMMTVDALLFSLNFRYHIIKLYCVYFPCLSLTVDYIIDVGNCVGFIESSLQPCDNVIIVGDVNFPCIDYNVGFLQFSGLLAKFDMAHCDDLFTEHNPITYVSSHLGCSSFIDHCFISNCLRHCLAKIEIVDSAINLSDHLPIMAYFNFQENQTGLS
jgi:hypothetical protein